MLAPVLDRALALVSTGKNAKDLGLTQLTQLVKDVKACAIYSKATALAASATASASGSTGGGAAATTNGKGKKSQPSTNAPSKDASAAAPADITLPTTPYTPLSPPAISALPPVDLTALGLMSALKLLFTEALHSAFPQVPS